MNVTHFNPGTPEMKSLSHVYSQPGHKNAIWDKRRLLLGVSERLLNKQRVNVRTTWSWLLN